MSNTEKLNYSCRRKTLKGKLHRSLSLTSFLSVMISLISVIILLALLINPIGNFITDSISNKIHRNYIISTNMETVKESNIKTLLDDKTYDEIIELSDNKFTAFDEEKLEKVRKDIIEFQESSIQIYGDLVTAETISEEEKKIVLASTYYALQDIDHFLSFGESIGINWVNIRLTVDDTEIFKIPRDYDLENTSFTQEKFNDIQSITYLVDRHDNVVGEIVTSLNTSVMFMVLMPITILFILIAGMTLIIVRILVLPLQHNILKPVHVLNKELKKIAEYDEIECEDITIEQKKPPTEIKELIDYSNTIINKLQLSNHILESQRDELEAQNIELDVQKEALEEQNIELDAQKEELSAQNEALIESQEQLKNAQNQLVQSEKMASMGQLTAAIMHEINTPLGAVKSNNQMVKMMLDKLEVNLNEQNYESALKVIDKIKKSSDITDDASNRVSEIIRNLKNFSRIDQAEFQNSDINDGIRSVLVLTSNLWKNKVDILESYGQIPLINCYPSMLNQVFMNIIVNAIQACDKNGVIKISTHLNETNVDIIIEDNGSGIKKSDLEYIFDSGFTTKATNEGTGLGLSISKDIINKHNGTIQAYNNEVTGTTFKISLPIKQS